MNAFVVDHLCSSRTQRIRKPVEHIPSAFLSEQLPASSKHKTFVAPTGTDDDELQAVGGPVQLKSTQP